MGIVEGITEWLPISSTGHMILLEQIIKFNASEEFMSMFRVVIQLGAIMAVVVLFWGKLWPFGMKQGRVISKPSVWNLWFKVVAATIPVLIISPLDDWMEAHFYNYITVAAMLILYGALFFGFVRLGLSQGYICLGLLILQGFRNYLSYGLFPGNHRIINGFTSFTGSHARTRGGNSVNVSVG